jgi:hypothetical protein
LGQCDYENRLHAFGVRALTPYPQWPFYDGVWPRFRTLSLGNPMHRFTLVVAATFASLWACGTADQSTTDTGVGSPSDTGSDMDAAGLADVTRLDATPDAQPSDTVMEELATPEDVADDTTTTPSADVAPEDRGNVAQSCGSALQGLEPVDCTRNGDTAAFCVFSNHCACGEGFECETPSGDGAGSECAPGVVCVPASDG